MILFIENSNAVTVFQGHTKCHKDIFQVKNIHLNCQKQHLSELPQEMKVNKKTIMRFHFYKTQKCYKYCLHPLVVESDDCWTGASHHAETHETNVSVQSPLEPETTHRTTIIKLITTVSLSVCGPCHLNFCNWSLCWERERERESERQRQWERQTERERQRDREIVSETETETDRLYV